jgi:hypothetical protein
MQKQIRKRSGAGMLSLKFRDCFKTQRHFVHFARFALEDAATNEIGSS